MRRYLLVLLLGLVGCGGDEDNTDEKTQITAETSRKITPDVPAEKLKEQDDTISHAKVGIVPPTTDSQSLSTTKIIDVYLTNLSRINDNLTDDYATKDDYGAGDKLQISARFDSESDDGYPNYDCEWIIEGKTSNDNKIVSDQCIYQLRNDEYLNPIVVTVKYHLPNDANGELKSQSYRFYKRFPIDHKTSKGGTLTLYNDGVLDEQYEDKPIGRPLQPEFTRDVTSIFANYEAFAAVNNKRLLFTWGRVGSAGSDEFVQQHARLKIKQVANSLRAFVVLDQQGKAYIFGRLGDFIDTRLQGDKTYTRVIGSPHGFALETIDGQICIVTDTMSKADFSGTCKNSRSPIKKFISQDEDHQAFAVLTENGKVFDWGRYSVEYKNYLASLSKNKTRFNWDLYLKELKDPSAPARLNNIKDLVGNSGAFVALTDTGTVVPWGSNETGGTFEFDYAGFVIEQTINHQNKQKRVHYWSPLNRNLEKIRQIVASDSAFAALTRNGDVITWGSIFSGGNTYDEKLNITDQLQNIIKLHAFDNGFSAIKKNGSIISWQGIWDTDIKRGDQIEVEKYYIYDGDHPADKFGWFQGRNIKNPDNINNFITNGLALLAISHNDTSWTLNSWGYKRFGGGLLANKGNSLVEILIKVQHAFADTNGFTVFTANGDIYSWKGEEDKSAKIILKPIILGNIATKQLIEPLGRF